MRSRLAVSLSLAVAIPFALAGFACSNINEDVYPPPDAGKGANGDASANGLVITIDGGTFGLPANPPPADPGPGGVLFAASGEVLALTGYPFPPAQPGAAAMVDGWELKFARLLTTVDRVTLSENPDTAPGDQSRTGRVVAELDGPWAFDLSRSDPTYLAGKGAPGEQAVPFAALDAQNQNGGASFPTDGTRYAFGFETVPARADAKNVNLDAAALADYKAMIDRGCVTLYVGTATFKGNKADPSCYPAAYASWPDVVDFSLCFKSPSTYVNCQNADNDPAAAFAGEEHQRGVALMPNKSVIAQVTVHTDHPFWDSVLHDTPAHFDPYAARVVGQATDGGPPPVVTLEMTAGVDYTAYTDALGNKLSWRYCLEPGTDVHTKFTGPMAFDPQNVPHATGGNPATGLRDFYDFATYNQSTQGHLNSDGLCFVRRNYASPN